MGEAGLHAGLFDREKSDEAAFFGGGPDGLGWGEVAELGGADGAGQAGRGRQRDLDFLQMLRRGAYLAGGLVEPGFEVLHFEVAVDDLKVLFGLVMEVFLELVALMAVMEGFDGLFEADGDEETDDDGGDVDEEVSPGAGGVVGWVDVEHGGAFLGRRRFGRFLGIRWGQRERVWLGHESVATSVSRAAMIGGELLTETVLCDVGTRLLLLGFGFPDLVPPRVPQARRFDHQPCPRMVLSRTAKRPPAR